MRIVDMLSDMLSRSFSYACVARAVAYVSLYRSISSILSLEQVKRGIAKRKSMAMLSGKLGAAVTELLRQRDSGALSSPAEVTLQACMLLRAAALGSSDASATVAAVRDAILSHDPLAGAVEPVAALVATAVATHAESRKDLDAALNKLVEQVRESTAELAEQAATILPGGDCVVVLGEAPGGAIEKAIAEAARSALEEHEESGGDGAAPELSVHIVQVQPDHKKIAEGMRRRLSVVEGVAVSVTLDACCARAFRGATKALLHAQLVDPDAGAVCPVGALLVASAARRAGVPVVTLAPAHSVLPVGSSGAQRLVELRGNPGAVWCYEEARADSTHEPIEVSGALFDRVSCESIAMVVTEFGGYSPLFLKDLAP